MQTTVSTDLTCVPDELLLQARQILAAALAMAWTDPRWRDDAFAMATLSEQDRQLLREAWRCAVEATPAVAQSELGLGELPPVGVDIDGLLQWLDLPLAERATAWQAVFGLLVSRRCPPYETEYCHWHDPTYRANQLADVAGFYSAFGVEPNRGHPQRADHVSIELEFLALLLQKQVCGGDQEQATTCRQAAAAFMQDHLAWWLPTFAHSVELEATKRVADANLAAKSEGAALLKLTAAAMFTRAWLAAERTAHAVAPSRQIISPVVEPLPDQDVMTCGAGSCGGDT